MGVTPLAELVAPELLAERHNLAGFTCGEAALDDWLRRRARANQVSGASRTYIVSRKDHVVGYHSLASGAIAIVEAPGAGATEHARSDPNDRDQALGR